MNDTDVQHHTPGPWRARPFGRIGDDGPSSFAIGPDGNPLAETFSFDEQAGNDATLMAAAPDLLKVAQSIIYVHEHSGSNAAFVLRGLVEDARAAIAKATS